MTNIHPHQRLIKIQRQLLLSVRAEVRKLIGRQSTYIKKYYEAYKREFRVKPRVSSKHELISHCLKNDFILIGDYHTFSQSQKAALRILRELISGERPLILGLEAFLSEHQTYLDKYIARKISETEFLKLTDYENTWGFSWHHFKTLLDFAAENKIKVLGLNIQSSILEKRDEHAANILARFAHTHSRHRFVALYGDLHLARNHLPKTLKRELLTFGIKGKILTVFQNSETVYFKLATLRLENTVDVIRLSKERFCIMNAPPWVKLQSYLNWSESGGQFHSTDDDGPDDFIDLDNESTLLEQINNRMRTLSHALGFPEPKTPSISLMTMNRFSQNPKLSTLSELETQERKLAQNYMLGNRSLYSKKESMLFLPSESLSSFFESVAIVFHSLISKNDLFHTIPRHSFHMLVLMRAGIYLCIKILNHKRKCALESDFLKAAFSKKHHLMLPLERLERRISRQILVQCESERKYLATKRYKFRLKFASPSSVSVLHEVARGYGYILGEKLYHAYVGNILDPELISKLFKSGVKDEESAKKLYLELIAKLVDVELPHQTKLDRL